MEEGFGSGPAGVSRWLFLPQRPRPARADSAVYQPAKPSVISSEPEQSEQPGEGYLLCLGDSDNITNQTVEQSGSRVSDAHYFKKCEMLVHLQEVGFIKFICRHSIFI